MLDVGLTTSSGFCYAWFAYLSIDIRQRCRCILLIIMDIWKYFQVRCLQLFKVVKHTKGRQNEHISKHLNPLPFLMLIFILFYVIKNQFRDVLESDSF